MKAPICFALTILLPSSLAIGDELKSKTVNSAQNDSAQAEEQSVLKTIYSHHVSPTITDAFDSTGWSILAIGTALTLLGRTQDDNVRNKMKNHQLVSENVAKVGAIYGAGFPLVLIAGTQLLFDRPNGYAHAEGLIFSTTTTGVLKTIVSRKRPSRPQYNSFPSGHSNASFTTATSLALAYGWVAAIPAYFMASLTMASRIADDVHWLSDTIAGATLGVFWARAAYVHHDRSFEIAPIIDEKTVGLSGKLRF